MRIFLLLSIFALASCKEIKKTEQLEPVRPIIETTLGSKLIIPDSLVAYSPFSNYIYSNEDIEKSEYKIYSKLDASCGTCISRVNLWINIVADFKEVKVPIVLVCSSNDEFELLKYLCETEKIKGFQYPFF
ncbi:MAG TPA: hypothetical protein DDZ39_10825 [Flavobacteriaceae bacterium]|jgi:hypothetical protein|nr:hypothetical protein [Flavobacteriaceae bacterium]HBS12994.1 hypothetical protein [Flavobacteriaceae bacterium]